MVNKRLPGRAGGLDCSLLRGLRKGAKASGSFLDDGRREVWLCEMHTSGLKTAVIARRLKFYRRCLLTHKFNKGIASIRRSRHEWLAGRTAFAS
jgi:hypothetical protein